MADGDAPPDPPSIPQEGIWRSPKRIPTPPTELEHKRWWLAYREDPSRGLKLLSAAVHANIHRVRHAVQVGWPDLGIVAFRTRLPPIMRTKNAMLDTVTAEVQAQAIAQVAKVVIGTWEDAARAQLASLNSATAALTKLAESLDKASAGASFVSYRKVPDVGDDGKVRRDEKGNAILIMKPFVSGHAVAMAAARLAVAAKDHAMLGKVLLGSLAPPAKDDPARMRDPRFMTTTERRARRQLLRERAAVAGFVSDADESSDAG